VGADVWHEPRRLRLRRLIRAVVVLFHHKHFFGAGRRRVVGLRQTHKVQASGWNEFTLVGFVNAAPTLLRLGEVRNFARVRLGGVDGTSPPTIRRLAGRRAKRMVRDVPAAHLGERHHVRLGRRPLREERRRPVPLGDGDHVSFRHALQAP
jgi:hypothetical protein